MKIIASMLYLWYSSASFACFFTFVL